MRNRAEIMEVMPWVSCRKSLQLLAGFRQPKVSYNSFHLERASVSNGKL